MLATVEKDKRPGPGVGEVDVPSPFNRFASRCVTEHASPILDQDKGLVRVTSRVRYLQLVNRSFAWQGSAFASSRQMAVGDGVGVAEGAKFTLA